MNQVDLRDDALSSEQIPPRDDIATAKDGLAAECEKLRRQAAALRRRAVSAERGRAAAEIQLVATRKELERLRGQLRAMINSTMWQVFHPVRRLGEALPPSVRRTMRGSLRLGWWMATLQLPRKLRETNPWIDEQDTADDVDAEGYDTWVERYDTLSDDDRLIIDAAVDQMPSRPLISVVMPVYETPERCLRAAIESVRAQRYPHWELCIADDASSSPHIRYVLEEYRRADPRIKICFREENGHISACTNSASLWRQVIMSLFSMPTISCPSTHYSSSPPLSPKTPIWTCCSATRIKSISMAGASTPISNRIGTPI
jgi:hypothetical protein